MGDYNRLKTRYLHEDRPNPFTDARMAEASHAALGDLDQWIRQNHVDGLDQTSPTPLLGPVMDQGTYYYRIGDVIQPSLSKSLPDKSVQEGWGLTPEQMNEQKLHVTALGLPTINGTGRNGVSDAELNAINRQYYETLNNARPDRDFIVKHFPGGDERVETTERNQMHYGKDAPIGQWIGNFDPILQDPRKPPFGIMLSHASYDLHSFPGIDHMASPNIPSFVTDAVKNAQHLPPGSSDLDAYSQVPASMNPYVTQYLRDVKGYRGVIIGDWQGMGASEQFSQSMRNQFKTLAGSDTLPSNSDVQFIMTVTTGADYVRPIHYRFMEQKFWDDFRKNSPEAYKQFDDKLNQNILDTYQKLKDPSDPSRGINDIAKLSIRQKVALVSSDALSAISEGEKLQSWDLDGEERRAPDKALFEVMNKRHQIVANSTWDRTGIMTMQFRKSVVEHISGDKFPDAPASTKDEESWLKGLMADKKFRQTYDHIDWRKAGHFADQSFAQSDMSAQTEAPATQVTMPHVNKVVVPQNEPSAQTKTHAAIPEKTKRTTIRVRP